MTLPELFRALFRFWPVLLTGLVLTPAAGYIAISGDGVYFTRTEVIFLAPTSSLYPNALRTQSEDIIVTAGVVAKIVTGPDRVTKFTSPDVTLVGMGVTEGWSLRLPDTGGQWATNFATQRLVLDIVAPSQDDVRAKQAEVLGQISDALAELQRAEDVDPVNDITAAAAPQTSVIYHVGGNRYRALGMTALVGAGVTVGVVVFLEQGRLRRRNGRGINAGV